MPPSRPARTSTPRKSSSFESIGSLRVPSKLFALRPRSVFRRDGSLSLPLPGELSGDCPALHSASFTSGRNQRRGRDIGRTGAALAAAPDVGRLGLIRVTYRRVPGEYSGFKHWDSVCRPSSPRVAALDPPAIPSRSHRLGISRLPKATQSTPLRINQPARQRPDLTSSPGAPETNRPVTRPESELRPSQ